MKKIYLIPNSARMEESLELVESLDGAFEYNDFWNPNYLDDVNYTRERIDFYRSLGRDRSSDMLHGSFLDVTVHSDDPMIRKVSEYRVKQSIEIANQLGVCGVVFHTNIIPNFQMESYVKHWVERNQEFFSEMAVCNPNINIYMENMFDINPNALYQLAVAMRDIPNFGICFDYAHANVFVNHDYQWDEAWFPYIQHVHINDNDGKQDLHLPVGTGSLDWQRYQDMMSSMAHKDCKPSVLIEVDSIEAQKSSIAYMQEQHLYPF